MYIREGVVRSHIARACIPDLSADDVSLQIAKLLTGELVQKVEKGKQNRRQDERTGERRHLYDRISDISGLAQGSSFSHNTRERDIARTP